MTEVQVLAQSQPSTCWTSTFMQSPAATPASRHVAARLQQLVCLGVQRVVTGLGEHREPPCEQRGRGGDARADVAGAHHVDEPAGFTGQRRPAAAASQAFCSHLALVTRRRIIALSSRKTIHMTWRWP